jgi:flagellar hook protein FlgE
MSFDIALSGINAINTELDTISNNIANSGTYGFRSSRANFSSVYAGTQPVGTQVSSLTQSINEGGSVLSTGRAMDAAIQGRGFFVTKNTDGSMLYTRVGIFATDKDGYVVDSFGHRAQGYATVGGATALGAPGDLQVPTGQVPAKATGNVDYVGNLSADWPAPTVTTFDPTNPKSYNSSMVSVVYDSLGVKHSLTQYFVSGGPGTNTVDVYGTFDGTPVGSPTAIATLDFNATATTTVGQLNPATAPTTLTFAPATFPTIAGAGTLSFNIDYTGTTQYAGEAVTTTNSADGYASGVMTGVQIDKDGSVMALYNNGQKQSIGILAIATFPNENGLVPVSDTAWTTSKDSGNALYFAPGVGTAGTLATGSLEQSNVDVASELVGLMTSQRNYQANTKVISTESQMMQALMQAV